MSPAEPFRQLEELVQMVEAMRALDERRRAGLHLYLGPGDETGQAQTADRREITIRMLAPRAFDTRSIGAQQFEPNNVVAEAAVYVVVLSMHIVRNRAADGDELGARRHGQKPPPRQNQIDDVR